MIAFIQSLEAHVFTFKEVAGYVTIAVCMSFAVGFLIAAFTRIFKEQRKPMEKWKQLAVDKDHYIDAVREYRNFMHSTLREAKDAVDAFLTYNPK